MSISPPTKGDLGEFVIAELSQRGLAIPRAGDLPSLPASWRTQVYEAGGKPAALVVTAQGCTFPDICGFFLSLFAGSRIPQSPQNDESFAFTLPGLSGRIDRANTGLSVRFREAGLILLVSESEHGLHIGFTQHVAT